MLANLYSCEAIGFAEIGLVQLMHCHHAISCLQSLVADYVYHYHDGATVDGKKIPAHIGPLKRNV